MSTASPHRAAVPPHPVPVVAVGVGVLVIAALLGWMGRVTSAGAFTGAWEFSRLGGPWLIGAFVAGAIAGWRRRGRGLWLGVVAGAVAIAAGSLAYYGISIWFELDPNPRRAAKLGVGWAMAGCFVGGALGMLGALFAAAPPARAGRWWRWRIGGPWPKGAALGALGGLLMGESIALLWVWDFYPLRVMATLEGLGGVAIVALSALSRSWRWTIAAALAAAVTATVAPIVTTMVREALRTIGWAGA